MNLVVANWKMNPKSAEDARVLASRIERGLLEVDRRKVEAVICPPQVFLPAVRHSLHFAALGAQNVSAEENGAFTGEVSAGMLNNCGAKYCIVGHSERRRMGETDTMINSKIKLCFRNDIAPILCVGFGATKSSSVSAVKRIVKRQIGLDLEGIKTNEQNIVITYEPLWVIGTGEPATPAHAAEILDFVRELLPKARLLYGGSMDSRNARAFASERVIQGSLVGGASLDVKEFTQIIKAFAI